MKLPGMSEVAQAPLRRHACFPTFWRAGRDCGDAEAPIYGWFTEGFGIPDLKEAKTLLDELS